jgi:Sec-independent protein translocase protein TatA
MGYSCLTKLPYILSSVQGQSLGEIKKSQTQKFRQIKNKLPGCNMQNGIADLKDLLVSVRKELNEMKTEFMEEIKAMWKDTKEEKCSKKKVSTNQAKNKCML